MNEFHDQIAQYRAAIEEFLQKQFCKDLPQKRLFDAMRYSLLAGGKRIRPFLTLEFCRMLGGSDAAALPYAAAIDISQTDFVKQCQLSYDDVYLMIPNNRYMENDATLRLIRMIFDLPEETETE